MSVSRSVVTSRSRLVLFAAAAAAVTLGTAGCSSGSSDGTEAVASSSATVASPTSSVSVPAGESGGNTVEIPADMPYREAMPPNPTTVTGGKAWGGVGSWVITYRTGGDSPALYKIVLAELERAGLIGTNTGESAVYTKDKVTFAIVLKGNDVIVTATQKA
jgi:hypothetical protein